MPDAGPTRPCPRCRAAVPESAEFCPSCGAEAPRPTRAGARWWPPVAVLLALVLPGLAGLVATSVLEEPPAARTEPEAPAATPAAAEDPGSDEPLPEGWARPELEIAYTLERPLQAREQARLEGEDGLVLTVPEGALPADTTVRIRKGAPRGSTSERIAFYDIDLGGQVLATAATLQLPLERPDEVERAEHVVVDHFHVQRGRWERMEASLTADGKAVVVQSREFSPVRKEEPAMWALYDLQAAPDAAAGPLPVPYYNQSDYGWCWAASLAMIAGAFGHDIKIWDVAAVFDAARTSPSVSAGRLVGYLKALGLTAESNWFYGTHALNGYVRYQIDHGRPVWMALPYVDHVVVAVGYTPEHVIVHDPSGALLKIAVGEIVSEPKLANYRLGWEWFDAVVGKQYRKLRDAGRPLGWLHMNPGEDFWSNQTIVATEPKTKGKTLSLQLMPTTKSFRATHLARLLKSNAGNSSMAFNWDGETKLGYRVEHPPSLDAGIREEHPQAVCNTDSIEWIQPYVANTGPAGVDVEIDVRLDGVSIAEVQAQAEPKAQQRIRVDTPVLDLTTRPLTLAEHVLEVVLRSGGAEVDRAEVVLDVFPGLVRGLKARRLDERHVRLSWSAMPEASHENTRGSVSFEYLVYRQKVPRGKLVEIGRTDPGALEFMVELAEDEVDQRFNYGVRARDQNSGRASFNVLGIPPKKAINYYPLLPGTRLEYAYSIGGLKIPGVSWSEVVTVPSEQRIQRRFEHVFPAKEGSTRLTSVTDEAIIRGPDYVAFGNGTVEQRMVVTTKKGKKTGEQSLAMKRSGAGRFFTDPDRLEQTPTWSDDVEETITQTSRKGVFDEAAAAAKGAGSRYRPGTVEYTYSAKVLGFEKVTVPAGTFENCLKLETKARGSTSVTWFAPDVGPVKDVTTVSGATMTRVLTAKKLPAP